MTAFRNPTLYAALATFTSLALASACGSLDERDFSGDPSDVGDGDGDGDGDTGGTSGDGDGDGDGLGGAMTMPPVIVDDPPPNPGCEPPAEVAPLSLETSFPPNGRSSSATEVIYDFGPLSKSCAVIECRLTHGDNPTGDWAACPTIDGDSTKVKPFTDADSQDETKNGSYEIEMRERFEGAAGGIFSRTAYLHNSLHGVPRCPVLPVSDAQILNAAQLVFQAKSAGSLSSPIASARVLNPFIQFDFNPPTQGAYEVRPPNGQVEYLSLRKHFVLNGAGTIVMMKRIYESRRIAQFSSGDVEAKCYAMTQRVHIGGAAEFSSNRCDAVAMNSQGFGLCLQVDDQGAVSAVGGFEPPGGPSGLTGYFAGVDHFMWSRLNGKIQHANPGGLVHFSPKCFGDPDSCEDWELFLPHRDVVLP